PVRRGDTITVKERWFSACAPYGLSDILRQPAERALPGRLVRGFVVASALVAAEAVARVIDVDLAIRPLLLDDLDVRHRNRLVLIAEVQERRHLRLEVGVLRDVAAVVADRGGEPVELVRRHEGDGAAHAEADDADLAGGFDVVDRGLHVAHHRGPVDLRNERARMRDLLRGIAALEI